MPIKYNETLKSLNNSSLDAIFTAEWGNRMVANFIELSFYSRAIKWKTLLHKAKKSTSPVTFHLKTHIFSITLTNVQ